MSRTPKKGDDNPGYEVRDARIRPVILSGLALFALVIFAIVTMLPLFSFFEDRMHENAVPVSPLVAERPLPEGPRLQVHPDQDWRDFKAQEDSISNNPGWISKDANAVRLPIEDAMQIMLEKGFPVRPQSGDSK